MKKHNIDYFNFGRIENKKFWKRLGGKPNFENKTVLDFGCGYGTLSVEIAESGAKKVLGIDLEEKNIEFAEENLKKNFPSLSKKLEFKKLDILNQEVLSKFDYIVSKDTFEHTVKLDKVLFKMYQILNINGRAFIGFGPLYNFYNGDHGRTGAMLPWFHLIIPEKMLIKRLNKKREKKINSIEELGLSKYSYKQYLNFFHSSQFNIDYIKANLSNHPVAPIFNLLRRIKFLEEYFTYNIYCILKKFIG
jgi:SAM-dependent methyltransferase